MAKGTYIGFEKTTPITYVNWAEVGANFNKKVDEELKRRDDLLKEIDESTNAIIDKANSQPRGNFQQGNDFMASVAEQVESLTTLQYKAFKDGLVTQKEYATFRNNVRTSTDDLITLRDSMEDYFTKLQEGNVSGESRWEAEQIEGLAKFGTSMPILDDMTGQFNLAKKIVNKDGTISAGETLSAAELKFFMGRIYENYNLGEEAKKATDRLGEVTRTDLRLTNKYGGLNRVISLKDKKAGEYNMLSDRGKAAVGGYIDWEDKTVESIMSNPHTKASIASEFLGMTYTYNEGDVDDKTIFKNRANEGNPEFTTDQDEAIAQVIRLQLRASIDVEEKVTKLDRTPYPPDYGKTSSGAGTDKDVLSLWAELPYAKDADDANLIINGILGNTKVFNTGLQDIDILTDDNGKLTGLEFKYSDEKKNLTVPVGTNIDFNRWMDIGSPIHGTRNPKITAPTGQFKTNWKGINVEGRKGELEKPTYEDAYKKLYANEIDFTKLKENMKEEEAVAAVKKMLKNVPDHEYTVRNWRGAKDGVVIQNKDGGEVLSFELNDLQSSQVKMDDFIKDLINEAYEKSLFMIKFRGGDEYTESIIEKAMEMGVQEPPTPPPPPPPPSSQAPKGVSAGGS